jgi:hypothetical protein
MSDVVEIKTNLPDATKLPEPIARRTVTAAAALAIVGVALSIGGAVSDPQRFAFSYLTGFAFSATIVMGALFFVLLQHLTKAGWSVAARRQMEWVAGSAPILFLLFIPVIVFGPRAYGAWWAGSEALHDELLAKKEVWLNHNGFMVRGFIYIAIISALGWWFSKESYAQDTSGDPGITARLQKLSAPMMLVFALTISFAGFDWLMSLQPHWYSTIFGVYTFAGAFVSSLAVLGLMTIALQRSGLYKRVSTVEHRHDIGKLLFAFIVFWSYIAFSQFMLIFYANLPEETIFFRSRYVGAWQSLSWLLVFGHFVFPFSFLLSRHVKRHPVGFTVGAAVILAMHYIDMYWLVMPIYDPTGEAFLGGLWIDLGGLLAPAGILALVVALLAARTNLFPIKDPRLGETLQVENF